MSSKCRKAHVFLLLIVQRVLCSTSAGEISLELVDGGLEDVPVSFKLLNLKPMHMSSFFSGTILLQVARVSRARPSPQG